MNARSAPRFLAVLAMLSLLGVADPACTGGTGPPGRSAPQARATWADRTNPLTGGTYRTAIEDFGFTGAFDPTGEYLGTAWGLYSDLLLRTLMTYNHVAGVQGDSPVPDLAVADPDMSADGLTYTFRLKTGVKFGPPLDRDVTSKDIEYAFERINAKSLVAQYGFYYDGVIVGMTGQEDSVKPVAGIETPDDSTIVFHLTQPTGDFLYRLALPATAPVPREVARCFTTAGGYGRDVISSGPYMIRGEEQLDVDSCDSITPISGFDPDSALTLVRNPGYDPATDSPEIRENHLDGVHIQVDRDTADLFQKVQAGELDGTWASTPPSSVLREYLTTPALRDQVKFDSGDRTWFLSLNLLTPPFDDVHVRRAVNYVIDKQTLQQAWGGLPHGDVATHIIPPTVLDFGGEVFDPYQTPNEAGSIEEAEREMSQSAYDHDHDGICDDPACTNVLFVTRSEPPIADMTPSIVERLSFIGIKLVLRELDTGACYSAIQTVANLIPISACPGWGKDYADSSTFAVVFDSSGISCEGQVNYSELGMSADQARECGVSEEYDRVAPLPSADADIARCNALSDDERTTCWIEFDKKLMTEYVPWVPYLWGNVITVVSTTVQKYEFDQFSGTISWCHIAVPNGVDPESI